MFLAAIPAWRTCCSRRRWGLPKTARFARRIAPVAAQYSTRSSISPEFLLGGAGFLACSSTRLLRELWPQAAPLSGSQHLTPCPGYQRGPWSLNSLSQSRYQMQCRVQWVDNPRPGAIKSSLNEATRSLIEAEAEANAKASCPCRAAFLYLASAKATAYASIRLLGRQPAIAQCPALLTPREAAWRHGAPLTLLRRAAHAPRVPHRDGMHCCVSLRTTHTPTAWPKNNKRIQCLLS
jgi:hypothetical protein